jgi:hypothetical protein
MNPQPVEVRVAVDRRGVHAGRNVTALSAFLVGIGILLIDRR